MHLSGRALNVLNLKVFSRLPDLIESLHMCSECQWGSSEAARGGAKTCSAGSEADGRSEALVVGLNCSVFRKFPEQLLWALPAPAHPSPLLCWALPQRQTDRSESEGSARGTGHHDGGPQARYAWYEGETPETALLLRLCSLIKTINAINSLQRTPTGRHAEPSALSFSRQCTSLPPPCLLRTCFAICPTNC